MRNLKKIFAVLVVVALMASMMVPALAAGFTYEAEATKLNNIKLMEGMNLGDKVTRIQALTFAIKAAGKNAEAQALTDAEVATILANVVDADKIPTWGKKYLAWAVKNNKTSGVDASIAPKIKFVADGSVDAKVFLFWVLTIGMGYEGIGTATATSKAVDAKVISVTQAVDFNLKGDITRDDAAGMLYGAAMTGVTAGGKTFIQSLIDAGFVSQQLAFDNGFGKAPTPVALGIESATALNLKQIQVVFNKEVNKDDAKTAANYEILDKGEGAPLAIGNVALASDNKTVTITLADGATALTNNSTAKVTVKKDFKDGAGVKLADAISNNKIAVGDTTFPTFDKVEAVGQKNLRLYFSEPVTGVAANDFSVKSGSYNWTVTAFSVNNVDKYVELTLGTNLLEGAIDVKVNTNAITDYAGLMVFEKTISYTYAKVATAPTVTIDSAKPAEVKLKFDRPVYGTVKVSHGVKDFANYTVSVSKLESAASDSWTFNFTGAKVPAGNITIFVFGDGDVKDLYGNKFAATSFTVPVVADTTAPAISSFKDNDGVSLDVTFDEAVWADANKTTNYELKKADGTIAILASAVPSGDAKKVTITPSLKLADNTSYILTVKKVKDLEGNEATNLTQSFTTGDNTTPSIKATYAVLADGKLFIEFSEAMNEAAMLTKGNYLVDNGAGFKALGDKDSVSKVNEKTVLIDLDAAANAGVNVMVSVAVTDLAGKKLSATALSVTTGAITAETLTITGAELIAKDKIKIKFDKDLASFASSDIVISAGATVVTIAAVESVSGKEAIVKTQDEMATNATFGGNAIEIDPVAAPANTKTANGTKLTGDAGHATIAVADKVAPAVAVSTWKTVEKVPEVALTMLVGDITNGMINKNEQARITITYTESLEAAISKLAFEVSGYNIDSVVVVANQIRITVTPKEDNTSAQPTVTQVMNIADAAGNVLTSGTSYVVREQ